MDDLAVSLHDRVSKKGRVTEEHLIGKDPQGPPVTFCAIGMSAVFNRLQDLGGEVIWCAHSNGRADLRPEEWGHRSSAGKIPVSLKNSKGSSLLRSEKRDSNKYWA